MWTRLGTWIKGCGEGGRSVLETSRVVGTWGGYGDGGTETSSGRRSRRDGRRVGEMERAVNDMLFGRSGGGSPAPV